LRGVRLLGINSDNDVATREHVWKRLSTDLRPRHLERISRVSPFGELPALLDAVVAGKSSGRNVIDLSS